MTLRLLLPPSVGSARVRARAELLDQSLRAALAEAVVIDVAQSYADLAERVERDEAHLVWMPSALDAVLNGEADFAAVTVRNDGRPALRDALASFGGRPAADRLVGVHATRQTPNDALGLTVALDIRDTDRIVERVFEDRRSRAQAALCLALDAEGFVRALPDEYASLRNLIAHG